MYFESKYDYFEAKGSFNNYMDKNKGGKGRGSVERPQLVTRQRLLRYHVKCPQLSSQGLESGKIG